jgi:purine-nucleoside phosphorylase
MNNYLEQVKETRAFLEQQFPERPLWAIILGSGLGNLANEMTAKQYIPYSEVPHFPVSTVVGHSGNLVFGYWNNIPILVMQGRFHFYEGYSMQQVTFPVRVFGDWGIKNLLISNAS